MKNFRDFFINIFISLKRNLIFPILNTFLPNFCINCHCVLEFDGVGLCNKCDSSIIRIYKLNHCKICCSIFFVNEESLCVSCAEGFHDTIYFDRSLSCFSYVDEIQELIKIGKFQMRRSIWKYLSKELINLILMEKLDDNYVIIPVPISKKRKRERGFNQSSIISKEIAKRFSMSLYLKALKKVKNNKPQSEKSALERKNNPKNCYKVINKHLIENKRIILVDDVFTTGSTVNECSRLLKESGAKEILVLTIAKRDFE